MEVDVVEVEFEDGEGLDFACVFPDELLCEIFSYLNGEELGALVKSSKPLNFAALASTVSCEWRRIANDQVMWKKLCLHCYESVFKYPFGSLRQVGNLLNAESWRDNYCALRKNVEIRKMTEFASGFFSSFLTKSGEMWVTGQSDKKIFPVLLDTDGSSPVRVRFPNDLRACYVSSRRRTFAAVLQDGSLWTWGEGADGKLGHGDTSCVYKPQLVEALKGIEIECVSAGGMATAALTPCGDLYTWGLGVEGSLGHGNRQSLSVPRCVVFFHLKGIAVKQVSVGSMTIALSVDNHVYTWGCGLNGRLGLGNTRTFDYPCLVHSLLHRRIVSVTAGWSHGMAVTDSGAVFTWGCGEFGRLGHGDEKDCLYAKQVNRLAGVRIVCVSATNFSAAVSDDGKLYTWGSGDESFGGSVSCVPEPNLALYNAGVRISSVSVGIFHMMTISDNGTVYMWGAGEHGELGHGDGKRSPEPRKLQWSCDHPIVAELHSAVRRPLFANNTNSYCYCQPFLLESDTGPTRPYPHEADRPRPRRPLLHP